MGLVLIFGYAFGCKQKDPTSTVEGLPASLEFDHEELLQLKTIQSIAVKELKELDGRSFYTTFRTDKIVSFPCSSCHEDPLEKRVPQEINHRWSHMDVSLHHAGESTMTCQTCHDYSNLQRLILLNNEPLNFNHSYQQCIQCHFTQGKDWSGGAHGKRLAGWQGKRVVMNCTDCHDPHSPGFDKRWPIQFPNIDRK